MSTLGTSKMVWFPKGMRGREAACTGGTGVNELTLLPPEGDGESNPFLYNKSQWVFENTYHGAPV